MPAESLAPSPIWQSHVMLLPKLLRELAVGTRVVTRMDALPGWPVTRTVTLQDSVFSTFQLHVRTGDESAEESLALFRKSYADYKAPLCERPARPGRDCRVM